MFAVGGVSYGFLVERRGLPPKTWVMRSLGKRSGMVRRREAELAEETDAKLQELLQDY